MIRATVRPELPSGTVTFLFTDVEGSTRLLEEIGDEAYEEALSVHRSIVRAACHAHDGVEVDTQGDAFFFAFSEPSGALAAAQQLTEGLAGGPIRVRVGLHTGTPRLGEEGYVGSDVHFCARVAASAHGGQVVLSQATCELVDGYRLTDLGEHRLKDIEHAVAIFQLGDESFPPLKTISNTNLPRPASSFVGREAELEEVVSRIGAGTRLLSLTGPGGTGKTRLGLEAATTLVPAYKAGVFWVGLASLRDSSLVTATIAQTLGAKNGLAEHIGERQLLLLLDNLEQVIEAAPDLSELLQACPNLTLLVTSRELLRISGEVEYAVPPLAESEAVSLFCERSGLEPSDSIAELCARLDSLPLAVELAAARTKALSVDQIRERLSSRLDLLKGGRDSDPRQQTLRATIEWSHDLLSSDEQQCFVRSSVFAGGCTLEAAEAVCDAGIDRLQSLVEKSLLRFTNERYWMLETIREYARQRLEDSGELSNLQSRHAHWLAGLAEQSEPNWYGADASGWVLRFESELENLRAAFDWAQAHDRSLALSIVANTWYFWPQTSRVIEQRRLLDGAWIDDLPIPLKIRALRAMTAAALSQNDSETVIRVSKERLELARTIDDVAQQAAAMSMLASGLQETGQIVQARYWFEEAIALDRAHSRVSASLGNLGRMERHEGNLARSRELLEEDLAEARATGNEINIAWSVKELAMTAIEEHAVSEALELLDEGFEISARVGLTHNEIDLVFGTAILASVMSKPRQSALLFGSGEASNEREGFEVLPTTSWWWTLHSRLGNLLGTSELEGLMEEGRALDHEQSVRRARGLLDELRGSV